jgi:hypothetical protein
MSHSLFFSCDQFEVCRSTFFQTWNVGNIESRATSFTPLTKSPSEFANYSMFVLCMMYEEIIYVA